MDPILEQRRQQRLKESHASLLRDAHAGVPAGGAVMATASSDQGVIRNGGRLGARWAPAAALTAFKRLTLSGGEPPIYLGESADALLEGSDFPAGQRAEEERLRAWAGKAGTLVHLGGGHDHVLPLLRSLGGPLAVLNVDAHCDTRSDDDPHSGNPFRLYAREAGAAFSLHQLGVQPFANGASTLSPLGSSTHRLLWRDQCEDPAARAAWLVAFEALPVGTRLVFSLDCDALAAAEIGAVSAPNPQGLTSGTVRALVRWYREFCRDRGQPPCYGVYEFNPLYDSVSGHSARVVANLLHEMLRPS